MRTLEQLRAANALERVHEISRETDEVKKRYRSYVERLGPGIVMNGLGQALATERAAAGDDEPGSARADGGEQKSRTSAEKRQRRRGAGQASSPGASQEKDPKARAHELLFRSVQAWICRPGEGIYPGASDVLHALVHNDERLYLHAQAEALAWLEWHKKFCRASFPRGERDD